MQLAGHAVAHMKHATQRTRPSSSLLSRCTPSEVVAVLTAINNGSVVTLLFGVLHDPEGVLVLAIASEVLECMAHRCPEALEDRGKEQPLGGVKPLGRDVDDVFISDGHEEKRVYRFVGRLPVLVWQGYR